MGIQDRDYFRAGRRSTSTGDRFNGWSGFALQAFCSAGLLAVVAILLGRIAGWFGFVSLPWIQGGGLYLIYGIIPVELLVVLWAAITFVSLVVSKGAFRGMACLALSGAAILLLPPVFVPSIWRVLFWRGPAGEFLQSRVIARGTGFEPLDPKIAKADGSLVWLQNNEAARDKSFASIREFLRDDRTDEIPYRSDKFVCADFAELLHNRAEAAGIRCGYVVVEFAGGVSHACNAFQTTDRGLVFIDCTGSSAGDGPSNHDHVVRLNGGSDYIPEYLFSEGWTCGAMGTVRSYSLHW